MALKDDVIGLRRELEKERGRGAARERTLEEARDEVS